MNELILKYAWQYNCFNAINLRTTQGWPLVIHRPGRENTDAGPDFSLAEITIDGTRWIGNVEIHVNSSDWEIHKHQLDKAYNNVILHVVFNHDKEIKVQGANLPTLELKELLEPNFISRYLSILKYSGTSIPCNTFLPNIDQFHVNSWLQRLLVERVIDKTAQILHLFQKNNGDIIETLYQWLAIGFGLKVNKDAFLILTRYLPYTLIRKNSHSDKSITALLFGVSGLLPDNHSNRYVTELIEEFAFLQTKYTLSGMNKEAWKFLRMRPYNFPTVKLAQFGALLCAYGNLLDVVSHSPQEINQRIKRGVNPFWNTHYSFRNETHFREKGIGEVAQKHLWLNTIQPFQLFLIRLKGNEVTDDIEDIFSHLPPENNKVTRKMVKAGFLNENSAHSQALIQLHNLYCDEKKCLKCTIGHQVFKMNNQSRAV